MAGEAAKSSMRAVALCSVAVLIAGCPRTPPSRPAPEAGVVPSAPAEIERGATMFDVDAQSSSVRILVYRGGALARLGHNHVMTVRDLRGRIWSHADIARSGFDLAFPVARLIVDDAAARMAAGDDFPGELSSEDREATRRNMLRAEVLDAAQYPEVQIRSVAVTGTIGQPRVSARITIRGASRDVQVVPRVQIEADRIVVSGEFEMAQTDFGITPFSAALGALQVQDRLRVQFRLVGVALALTLTLPSP